MPETEARTPLLLLEKKTNKGSFRGNPTIPDDDTPPFRMIFEVLYIVPERKQFGQHSARPWI